LLGLPLHGPPLVCSPHPERPAHIRQKTGGTPTKENEENAADDLEDGEVWLENDNGVVQMFSDPTPVSVGIVDDASVPCEAVTSDLGNRKINGRRRTHNEQTLVRPCGVICARATFYGAEAVSNVLVMSL